MLSIVAGPTCPCGRETEVNSDKVNKALACAYEFMDYADMVLSEARRFGKDYNGWRCGTPITAALRRKSMDLTRALAEMRKAN